MADFDKNSTACNFSLKNDFFETRDQFYIYLKCLKDITKMVTISIWILRKKL